MARRRPRARGGRPFTLEKMADGGIHDQLGGGFHRYSTDAMWLVPHFEQMLYDNAQLARVYLHAWALTGDARYPRGRDGRARLHGPRAHDGRRRVRRQPGRRHRRRRGPDVHLDARPRSARSSATTPRRSSAAYGVTETGNWEGVTILSRVWPEVHTPPPSREDAAFEAGLRGSRARLLERRGDAAAAGSRRQGARGLERAGDRGLRGRGRLPRATIRPATAAAARAAETIIAGLLAAGRRRSAGRGRTAGPRARASSRTTRTSPTACWRCTRRPSTSAGSRRPAALMDRVLARFADPAGGFFDTADDHERLVTRPKDVQDNAVPSGNAMAALRPAAAGRVDRRGPISRCRRAGDADGRRRSWPLSDGIRAVAVGDGPRARAGRRGGDRRGARAIRRRGPARRGRRAASARTRSWR